MQKFAIIAAVAVGAISAPAMAAPGNSSQANGNASAKVVGPITLTHDAARSLNFGTFTAGTTGGTVVVTQAGTGSTTGDVNLISGEAQPQSDRFTVTGPPNRGFSISVDSQITVTNTSDSSHSMSINVDAPTSDTLGASGVGAEFFVGGTLTVAPDQAPGDYEGSYSVTVAYS